jgi:CO/xanthine dehydrogenase Mo-binding subunit
VDRETGQIKVLKVVTAHDVGTVINPLAHQGQIDGGFVTGFGLAVTEELVSEGGQILNGHFGEYKLPTIADIPPLETVLVPTGGGEGPYQAKAIGELANNATAAAIANAVADAVGSAVRATHHSRESLRGFTPGRDLRWPVPCNCAGGVAALWLELSPRGPATPP